jgi:methionyl-tRNA synthetase
MYVWVDALTNYITGVGYPDTASGPFKTYWPADVHVIGKDIVRFHAVYWPAFLMSAGVALPKQVFGHGFLLSRGEKMSKSLGNVVDPFEMVKVYGLDQVRYFCLREVPFGQDGSYSHDAIVNRCNADLANDLGNLAQRSLSMVVKNCGGAIPRPGKLRAEDESLLHDADALLAQSRDLMKRLAIHRMLESAWKVVADANRYFAGEAPWALRKTDPERMGTVLYITAEIVRQVAILAQCAMPTSCGKLLDQLGVSAADRTYAQLGPSGRLPPDQVLGTVSPVFRKYEEPVPDPTAQGKS